MPVPFPNGIDLASQRAINAASPSAGTDLANRDYVDNVARGLRWKDAVRAATTTNGTLATAYANGQVVDGVTLATGDRILLKNQTTGADNGIYTVNSSGAPTRAVDADSSAEMKSGTAVTVTEGTTNGDKTFNLTTNDPITLGTTSLTFSLLGGGAGNTYVAGAGLTESPTGTFIVDLAIHTRKYSTSIGDGSTNPITVTHNLGTKDVDVTVRQNSDDTHVIPDIVSATTNTIILTFGTAPSSSQYRVTVIG